MKKIWPFIILFLTIFAIWLTWWVVPNYFPHLQATQRFDHFDALNALFSGLAFAAVIVALWLQREELGLQREELKLTRNELQTSAKAQQELSTNATRDNTLNVVSAYSQLLKATRELFEEARQRHSVGTPSPPWEPANANESSMNLSNYLIIKLACPHGDAAADAIGWIQREVKEPLLKLICLTMIKSSLNEWLLNFFLRIQPIDKWAGWMQSGPHLTAEQRKNLDPADLPAMRTRFDRWNRTVYCLDRMIEECRAQSYN